MQLKKITSIRNKTLRSSNEDQATNFRRFVLSTINVNAKVYYETIVLSSESITKPALIRQMTRTTCLDLKILGSNLYFLHFYHNQDVERYIELIAEAFKSVNGYDHCDNAILRKIKFRQMKKVNSKHHLT